MKIDVVIPAYNEETSIGHVINDIPKDIVRDIVVISNASTDNTEQVASDAGATVLIENQKGYGAACLKGLSYLKDKGKDTPDIVVFLDGDYSDYPEEMRNIIQPILHDNYEMVIGSRALGNKEKGAMMPQQIFGNWLATTLIKLFYGVRFTDLGPFRAITWEALDKIKMEDTNFGWTVEMQVKAARLDIRSTEVPVNYKARIGVSKVSGTLYGTVMAGYKIIYTIFKYAF